MKANKKIQEAKERARRGQLHDDSGYSTIRKEGKRPTKIHDKVSGPKFNWRVYNKYNYEEEDMEE